MKHLFTLIAVFAAYCSFSQNAEISGVVTDEVTKDPIQSAQVKFEKGKTAITDATGHYKLSVPEGVYDIAVSSIGYKRQKQSVTVVAGINQVLNFQMKTEAYEFQEVSTVSQYKKNAAKETVSIETVTAENIKHTNSNNLSEALGRTSGVLVQDGQITIRGGSSYSYGVGSRTAVLQDGLSLMSADLGQAQTNMAALSNAKQIEVVKGASSVIYGSSALNGVVNVVTDWPIEDTPKTTIDFNAGVYGNTPKVYQKWWNNALPFNFNVNVNHRRKVGNLSLVAGGNITGDNSYIQANNNWRAQGFFKSRYISKKVEGLNYGVDVSMQYETIDEFFIGKDADSSAFKLGAGSSSRYFRLNVDPHLTYATAKGHMYNLKIRYMNIDRLGNGTDPNAISHQIIVDNQYQYRLKHAFVLTAGAPFNVGHSSSNLYNDNHITFSAAVYTQLEYNIKWFSIQGGVRYEVQKVDDDLQKGRPVFRAGMNFEVTKSTHVRASWGQAYRIPTVGERDILQKFYTGVLVIPNDTLHAESGYSAEVGINQVFKIGKRFVGFVDLAVYYNRYDNFTQYDFGVYQNRFAGSGRLITVDTSYLNNVLGIAHSDRTVELNKQQLFGVQARNITATQIFGYELSVGGRGQIGKVGITLQAGYSYSFGSRIPTKGDTSDHYTTGQFFKDAFIYNGKRVEDKNSETYKHLLDYRVRHLFHGDIEFSYWRCYLGATFIYASFPEVIPPTITIATQAIAGNNSYNEFYVAHRGGDFIADMRAGYKVNKHFEVGFICKNLGNRFYMLRPGKPEPIRNYTVQFRYNF